MPRGQVRGEDGCSRECHSVLLPRYKRLTGSAGALIAGAYLAGVNTRRVRLALGKLFGVGGDDKPRDSGGERRFWCAGRPARSRWWKSTTMKA